MSPSDSNSFQARIIEDMRAHDGNVTQGPLAGHPLLIMTSTGSKTGLARQAILTYSREGNDYVVAGTDGGAPSDPAWMGNLRANPEVTVETGNRTFQATANVVEGTERDRLWTRHVETLPWFRPYPQKADRVIPIVRLTPA
ncbi:MAG TPA: nitroreductase family deazaflavin-dependent oxidoreductase [Candidatus Limnocylindrales bacterium]